VIAVLTAMLLCTVAQEPAPGGPRITGYMQPRLQAVGDSAALLLRRARIAVEGQAAPWATYRIQVEFRTLGAAATPSASPLTLSATDLWVRIANRRWAGTFGQFRVPYMLESVTSSGILETTERSRIVTSARRDIGVQAQWTAPGRVVVQAAVVNGDGPNRGNNPDNRMAYFARVVVTPVKGLDVGGALAGYSDSIGVDAQAIYRTSRWTARAEYVRDRHRTTDEYTTGWYALATYMLRPSRFQLVTRMQQFDPSDQLATDRQTGYLLGCQYFLRGDDLKVMTDYEVFREQGGGGAQVGNDRLVVQLQVRW
jgi:phosphate-selective porin OprO and OprP